MALRAADIALNTYDPEDRLPSLEFAGRSFRRLRKQRFLLNCPGILIPLALFSIVPFLVVVVVLGFLLLAEPNRVPGARTRPRPTRRFSTNPEKNSRSGQQKSIAIGKSNISLADCPGSDGNGLRFLLPNRSKPIFSAFLNCLGCSLKKTLLTPKTAAKLVSVVASDFLLTQIQNCFVTSHG
jgi:hypothetical protein